MVDVLIQTFNEALNLPHTLASVQGWARNIFIVDSGSTDHTREVAEAAGAKWIHHDWEGYAAQKNWALDHLDFESDWVLILDADEAVSSELREEITGIVSRPADETAEAGFYINRVFVFLENRIYHCGYFPSWNLRLFKTGKARYEKRLVHEHMIVDGPTGYLNHLLLHEDRRGLEHFFAKHNRYSTLEARELIDNPEPWGGFNKFMTDRISRRRFLKSRVLPHTPVPWIWRFLYMYVLRAGFLDGRSGWKLCLFISTYEFLIQIKYQELHRKRLVTLAEGTALAVPEGLIVSGGSAIALPDVLPSNSASLPITVSQAVPTMPLRPPKVAAVVSPTVVRERPSESRGTVLEPKHAEVQRKGTVKVSVVIPTLNEAGNLPRCLDHLAWADEVVVVDSGSSDKTVEIAHAYGCRVVDFEWNGAWPKKKNWALREAPLKHEWVLIVDADEWIMPELAAEIARAIQNPSRVGYYINRRFIFMGSWIKHCGYYPSWNLRLIKRNKGEYEQLTGVGNTGSGDNEVHEHVVPLGAVGYLENDMLHFAFPTIHTFMEKHNRYSNWEAAVQFRGSESETTTGIGDVLSKRRRLKNLSRKLPFRPMLRFLYAYVWKGGFLDGQPGYVFCRLLAIYEYLSVAKYTELKRAVEDDRKARSLSNVPPTDWKKSNVVEQSHA